MNARFTSFTTCQYTLSFFFSPCLSLRLSFGHSLSLMQSCVSGPFCRMTHSPRANIPPFLPPSLSLQGVNKLFCITDNSLFTQFISFSKFTNTYNLLVISSLYKQYILISYNSNLSFILIVLHLDILIKTLFTKLITVVLLSLWGHCGFRIVCKAKPNTTCQFWSWLCYSAFTNQKTLSNSTNHPSRTPHTRTDTHKSLNNRSAEEPSSNCTLRYIHNVNVTYTHILTPAVPACVFSSSGPELLCLGNRNSRTCLSSWTRPKSSRQQDMIRAEPDPKPADSTT